MNDQLFLRKEILRLCAGMGSAGLRRDTLLILLQRETFHELTDDELREQVDFLVAENLLTPKRSALDASVIRHVITEAGKDAID
jgi:hypothetical protein